MIFEDVHWSDPTSLEAFGRAAGRIANLSVLLLITFRPEFNPPWIGQPNVTSLTLNRLTRREVEGLIERVAGNKPLAANIRQDIVERTDGIPLFVEEMTKAVLETESLSAAAEAIAMVPRPALAVPASLHASLMGRLDRLGAAAKEVAQISAAIGREFSHTVLVAVMRKPETELQSALHRSSRPACCSGRALRMRRICSSMRLYKTPPTARFCASRVAPCTPGSPKLLKVTSLTLLRPARGIGASLHRGWLDRESCRSLGQGRTTVLDALGLG